MHRPIHFAEAARRQILKDRQDEIDDATVVHDDDVVVYEDDDKYDPIICSNYLLEKSINEEDQMTKWEYPEEEALRIALECNNVNPDILVWEYVNLDGFTRFDVAYSYKQQTGKVLVEIGAVS